MKNEKLNELISHMEILTENEKGLLKGGFTTLSSNTFSTFVKVITNIGCPGSGIPKTNIYCGPPSPKGVNY